MEKKKKSTSKKVNQKIKPEITLSNEDREKFLEAISIGTPLTDSLNLVGISLRRWYFWLHLANDILEIKENIELLNTEHFEDDGTVIENQSLLETLKKNSAYASDVVQFILDYKKATATFVYDTVNDIRYDANNNFAHSAWLLERLRPKDFGKKDPDKQVEEKKISKIKVEFVDSNNDKKRLENMEKVVQEELGGKRVDE